MKKRQNIDPNRPKRINKICSEIANICDRLHQQFTHKALQLGYTRDIFLKLSQKFNDINDDPIFEKAEDSYQKFKNFISIKEQTMRDISFDVSSSAFVFASATALFLASF